MGYPKYKNAPKLTDELFRGFVANDKTLNAMCYPKVLLKENGWPWDKIFSFTYPVEYEMTEEQVKMAKAISKRRHDEQLDSLHTGVLAWKAMGGDFPAGEDGIGNYRVRCYFANNNGRVFFVELLIRPDNVATDLVKDVDLYKVREKERHDNWNAYQEALNAYEKAKGAARAIDDLAERRKVLMNLIRPMTSDFNLNDKQDYYLHDLCHTSLGFQPTFTNVMEWINRTFNCSYHTSTMFNYFVDCDEYVCHCKSTKN